MATHEIKANLDVDGEVQGTSLDINGNADISGTTGLGGVTTITDDAAGALTIRRTSNTDQQLFLRGGAGSGEGRVAAQYSLELKSGIGGSNSYDVTLSTATGDNALRIDASDSNKAIFSGAATFGGTIGSGAITSTGKITGTELEGTSLDINGASAINGKVVIEGDSAAWNVTTPGKTTGSLHFDPGSTTNDFGNAITFGASDSGSGATGQAGIYIRSDGGYGTRMYFGTTNDYAAGSKTAFYINNDLQVYFNSNIIVTGEVEGASLDINGDADISGDLTGLDNVTSTNFIIGGHTINDVDVTSEASNADDHLMTAKAIEARIADNANSFLTSVPNHSGNLITSGTVAADRVATLNQNTTGTAAIATTVTVADESSDTSCNVLFATAATGNLPPKSGTNLTFNSSSGVLTATGFSGALTGNVTGNASGSSGSCTGNAATATLAATSTIASDTGSATHFPVFVDGSTGARALKAHANWTYNPGTETLSAGKLTTDVAAIVEDNKSNSALMTLTGQGAGDEGNVSLKMLGTSAGNPIKLKMAGLDDSGSQVGAGFLSYDAEDDSFGVGQSSSHNRMGIKIENTITVSSPNVHYEPTSIKAREYVASANATHYDFYGDIIRNGNDTTVRGKLYCYKNGTWTIANADTKLDANGMLGIAIGTNSTTHGMLLKGTYTLDYDPGSNGNPLYVSLTDGLVATAVPGNSGDIVRLVGYLLGGTHGNIFFNPDSTYVEVA